MISVVVPHQSDKSKPYLKLCLAALEKSVDIDYEVYLVDGSDTIIDYDLPKNFYHIQALNAVGVSQKLDLVMPAICKHSSHMALVSDDVMVSRYMLADMVSAFSNREMIMNPFSNSDCLSMYEADISLESQGHFKRLHPDMEFDDMTGWTDAVIDYPRRAKCLVPFPCVSFYCTMIPVSVWLKLGNLDPALEFRHNDQDYCLRAQKMGIPSVVNFGVFAFHFGSKTMRHMANDASKAICTDHFRKKWMGGQ